MDVRIEDMAARRGAEAIPYDENIHGDGESTEATQDVPTVEASPDQAGQHSAEESQPQEQPQEQTQPQQPQATQPQPQPQPPPVFGQPPRPVISVQNLFIKPKSEWTPDSMDKYATPEEWLRENIRRREQEILESVRREQLGMALATRYPGMADYVLDAAIRALPLQPAARVTAIDRDPGQFIAYCDEIYRSMIQTHMARHAQQQPQQAQQPQVQPQSLPTAQPVQQSTVAAGRPPFRVRSGGGRQPELRPQDPYDMSREEFEAILHRAKQMGR